jgi:hypothetical protein
LIAFGVFSVVWVVGMEENELRLLLQLSLRAEVVATLQPVRDFSENGRDRKIQTELDLGGRARRVEVKVTSCRSTRVVVRRVP